MKPRSMIDGIMTGAGCPLDSWMSSDGRITKICDLEENHLMNIVAVLTRTKDNPQRGKIISLKKELYKRLCSELKLEA